MLINEIELIPTDDMVVHSSEDGIFEKDTFAYIKDNLESHSLFIDVGAYTGVYSIYANKVKQCKVYAFEPNPIVFNRLTENVSNNRCNDNEVILMNFGLSCASGTAIFYINPNTKLTSAGSLCPANNKKMHFESNLEKFDDLEIPALKIDMIKIDVEGHEFGVLKGMEHTLKKDKPKLIVELLTDDDFTVVNTYLKSLGYDIVKRCDHRNYIYE